MKPRASNKSNAAMTLVEVLVVIAILILLAAVLIPRFIAANSRPQTISCANNVKQILLSYRIWAEDNGGKFPMEVSVANGGTRELIARGDVISAFQVVSNELVNPRILHCPYDADHSIFPLPPGPLFLNSIATNFSGNLKNHISYFIGLDANTNHLNVFLSGDDNFEIGGLPVKSGLLELPANSPIAWTAARHHFAGNIGLANGSVQQVTTNGLRQLLQQSDLPINRLAIP
jgi:competence protein ComGC